MKEVARCLIDAFSSVARDNHFVSSRGEHRSGDPTATELESHLQERRRLHLLCCVPMRVIGRKERAASPSEPSPRKELRNANVIL